MEQRTGSYDLIVVGAGPGGYPAALRAAQLGKRVALVERGAVGGTCLNRGCIPTKALLHTGELYRAVQNATQFGVCVSGATVDLPKAHAHKAQVVEQLRTGVEKLLEANGVDLIRAEAKICAPAPNAFADGWTVRAGAQLLYAQKLLLAPGSRPAVPPIPGAHLPGVVNSDALLAGDIQTPQRLLIIGGGVIGVEFATLYSTLGCVVTLVEAASRLLPALERELSQSVAMLLKQRGVAVYTGAQVQELVAEEPLTCRFLHKGVPEQSAADTILLATGRCADTEGLLDDALELQLQHGAIPVNDAFETCLPGIYAVGDAVVGSTQLAHAATVQGVEAVRRMFGQAACTERPVIPACVYTSPEIACVGLTADEAKAQGIPVCVGKCLLTSNGKNVIENAPRGFVKLVFHAQDETLLGAQILAPRATDMIGELATALQNGLTRPQMAAVVRPHPTFCEAVTEACEDAAGQALHALPKRR